MQTTNAFIILIFLLLLFFIPHKKKAFSPNIQVKTVSAVAEN